MSAHDVATRPASDGTAPPPTGDDASRQRPATFDDPLTEEVETPPPHYARPPSRHDRQRVLGEHHG